MPKILQINATANCGSTGRIAEQINIVAKQEGYEVFFAYGRKKMSSQSELIKVGNKLQVYEHYIEHRLFDNDGLASRIATWQLVKKIKKINPDIIHLHNIHDHWINYRILFQYLNSVNTPVVWTQHDCWSFTGGCAHFCLANCFHWRDNGCTNDCPFKQKSIFRHCFEKTQAHYNLKKHLFRSKKNLILVPVSHWLENFEKQSFLGEKKIITIHNGIDLNIFKPIQSLNIKKKYGINSNKYIIGVASPWSNRKGYQDFFRLASLIPNKIKIVLVGLNEKQMKEIQSLGIIGIPHTENVNEMTMLYNNALIFCNLTYCDTYPTTNLESIACGTPVLTYNTGGSVESVTQKTGWIVEQGNIQAVANIISNIDQIDLKEKMSEDCILYASKNFNKNDRFKEYINLYKEILQK